MQVLTPTGYKNIEDVNIGDELVAYDINTGAQILNILNGKALWTETMLPPVVDENGNVVETSEQVYQNTYGDWKFYLINNTWTVFTNQSVWANGNVVHGFQLQVGDVVYDDQDQDVVITDIQEVSGTEWWRLEVSGDHSYIADNLTLHNADRYWVGSGSSANWNATGNTNWGAASGGANNASVPTSVDAVIFDGAGATGNTASTISATITILSLNITTGYTQTMTHNAVVTIAGNLTFTGNYTRAGASGVTIGFVVSSITSNGVTWNLPLTLAGNTKTLVGNLTVSGLVTFNNGGTVINSTTSETATFSGGITLVQSVSGTAKIILTGGTWTGGGQTISNNLDINGNVTISGTVVYNTGTLTYVSGTVTTTGSTLTVNNVNATLNTNGITWNNFTFAVTVTLTSNMSVGGQVTVTGSPFINRTTTETLTIAGGIAINTTNFLRGTAKIILTGGTWTASATTNNIQNSLDIQGNVTISGTVAYQTGTLTYVSGTVTTTSSTLNITGSCTLNTNGITWNNISTNVNGNQTCTLTSNLSMSGLFALSVTITINRTTAETWTTSGGITVNAALLGGTAKIILTGGTWSGSDTSGISSPMDIQGNVTISGNVYYVNNTFTYVSGTVTTTGSTLNINGGNGTSTTLNTNGISWNNISINGSTKTITLTSNLTTNGLFTVNTATINKTTSETITCAGGLTTSGNVTGTAKIILTGGTWTGGSNIFLSLALDLDINGNITFSNVNSPVYGFKTLTYISGTVTTTGSTFNIVSGSGATLNTSGMTFNNFYNYNSVVTLTSNLTINGTLTADGATWQRTTAETITCNGLTVQATSDTSGTASIILTGGTWSATGVLRNTLIFNGNVTVSGNVKYRSGTLTYQSGTITTTSSTLEITNGATFNTNGITWNNVTFSTVGTTQTLNSNFAMSGLLTISVATVINQSTTQTWTTSGGITVNGALSGTVKIILTGGIWSGSNTTGIANNLDFQGDVTISGTQQYYGGGTMTYVSGNVTTFVALVINANSTLNTNGITWFGISIGTACTITLTSNLNSINGIFVAAAVVINRTTSETVNIGGITVNNTVSGTAKLVLTGGTWSGSNTTGISNNLDIQGNLIISGNVYYRTGTLNYVSGRIDSSAGTLNLTASCTLTNFVKTPLPRVIVTAGQTITMDRMIRGSAYKVCQISSTGANYTIAFQDNFEKMGRYVNLTGATLARPMQLLVISNSRFNTNRSTNGLGVRYNNQSPNGFARNTPSVVDTMTTPALGLEADPCFLTQG